MGIREPGKLLGAFESMRNDLPESDTEVGTTLVATDQLLIVLEAAREAALKDFVLEWLAYGSQVNLDNPAEAETAALGFLTGLAQVQAPFDELVPKEIPTYVTCGANTDDGTMTCELPSNHDGDHSQETDLGTVRWARPCLAAPDEHDGVSPLPRCDQAVGHDGEHFDSGKGVSW